jgi:hypothetical protein
MATRCGELTTDDAMGWFRMSIRPKNGTFYDGTAALNRDGTGRHFDRIEIINSPNLMTSVRPENGTFYDGTAALNT